MALMQPAQEPTREYLIEKAADVSRLELSPLKTIKKGPVAFQLSNIRGPNNNTAVVIPPPFRATGIYRQDEGDKQRFILRITKEDCLWLNPIIEEVEKRVFYCLKSLLSDLPHEQRSKWCQSIIDDGLDSMKPTYGGKEADVFFPKINTDSCIFVADWITNTLNNSSLTNMAELPRHGLYKIRLIPKFVYIGGHGSNQKNAWHITYTIDQVVYSRASDFTSPQQLAIDVSDFCSPAQVITSQTDALVESEIRAILDNTNTHERHIDNDLTEDRSLTTHKTPQTKKKTVKQIR